MKLLMNDVFDHANHISMKSHTTIPYYHIELDGLDVILAEGLPVESYLDTGNPADYFRQQRRPDEILS